MGLTKYKAKRNFKESPEPTGGKPKDDKLRFVIQKHAASHLHYDFRLEMEGVLKSWAVPKGPSTDPKVKRLAMMVEDHPYDYRNFEGIIPSGYGAGTVIIWDEGFYEPAKGEFKNKKEQDKYFLQGLKSGKLHFNIHGKKLKGEYALVKAHGRGENGWLLFKVKDEHASSDDITLKDKSVISKKTLEQIAKTSTHFYGSNGHDSSKKEKEAVKTTKSKKASAKKAVKKTVKRAAKAAKKKGKDESVEKDADEILKSAPKGKFPSALKPMLATLVDKPFEEEGWVYEVKWDGYRAVAFCNKKKVDLKSRNDKSFNDKFYPVVKTLKGWGVDAVIDGEVVVVGENGISNFGDLQNWRSEADGELLFYVFDVMWYEGKDLTGLPLTERKAVLQSIIPENSIIKYSESFGSSGIEFFEAAKKMGLEGIIAKKADSTYKIGVRNTEWLKIKANQRQEMVIGGFTLNDDSRKKFSALLVGVYDDGKLIYTGKIGTGFSDKTQQEMMKLFKPLITNKPPFTELPDINKPSRFRPNPPNATATWLKPKLVCEVSFTEMTSDGIMRHPSFEGMRIDKKSSDVIREKPKSTSKAIASEKISGKKIIVPSGKKERKTLLNPTDETQVRKVNGHELKFTNLSKFYWPKEKITKRDLLNYYYQMAPYILPYLKDRPQSMNRHPDGINGQHFFYKDVTGKAPDWVETFLYHSDADDRDRNYLVAKDDASLLYMASLGCIEMNPWHSRVETEDYPDWCIIDLDPAKNTFDQVIEAARVTKDVLDGMGVPSYPKTSGSTGIHIYIPLGTKYTYEQSKEFARVIARLVHQTIPEFTSIERAVKARKGKMYIDFLQNRAQATVSAPYSVRPKPGATVSMPLHWEEVKKGLKMTDFTIHNALDRVKSEGDIFKPVIGKGINLEKVIAGFEKE
ncbi:MAG: ligase [Bacteroidetes bacterium]|jgi:bifunctional non-homologous end joining protein LigD|nr:ligase [Bacteroidota bacterium]